MRVDAKTSYKGKKITFHDPCYLGRANKEYDAPRALIEKLSAELVEMKSCKEKDCVVRRGAQMFKDAEKDDKEGEYRTHQSRPWIQNLKSLQQAVPFAIRCFTMV